MRKQVKSHFKNELQFAKRNKTYLTEIHDDALVNLLPQVSPEDLNEGDLQCGDLAVHKDSCQVELYLETYIHLKTEERNVRCRPSF